MNEAPYFDIPGIDIPVYSSAEYYFWVTILNLAITVIIFLILTYFFKRVVRRLAKMEAESSTLRKEVTSISDGLRVAKESLDSQLKKPDKKKD